MSYKHLDYAERYYIYTALKEQTPIADIAKSINRHPSTLHREINRNTGKKGYRYKQANDKAQSRHEKKHKAIKLTEEVISYINSKLELQWSPEQICGRIKTDKNISIHHETIYKYLLKDKQNGGMLYMQLRHQKTYRKRYGSTTGSTRGIPNRVDIDQRPEAANNRERVGDWEADTIIGKGHKGAIVTLDDRKTKLRLAAPLSGKHADLVKDWITRLLKPFEGLTKTITFDNGKEFTKHQDVARDLDCETYFAKPYHSWERGQNENANGLLRQYFPKSMELVDISVEKVFDAIDLLNSRPRKCLGYRTPYEAFEALTGINPRKRIKVALMT